MPGQPQRIDIRIVHQTIPKRFRYALAVQRGKHDIVLVEMNLFDNFVMPDFYTTCYFCRNHIRIDLRTSVEYDFFAVYSKFRRLTIFINHTHIFGDIIAIELEFQIQIAVVFRLDQMLENCGNRVRRRVLFSVKRKLRRRHHFVAFRGQNHRFVFRFRRAFALIIDQQYFRFVRL